jgi:hypothetical protein
MGEGRGGGDAGRVPSASTRSITALIYEAVELGGVVADDLALSLCGKVAELALDVFLIEM